jgi:hypothetical protein
MALSSLIAWVGWVAADAPTAVDSVERSTSAEEPFHKDLLKVAAEYKAWGRVDDELRWAPGFCRIPQPGRVYVSASKDERTHGQKLYSVFARKRDEYVHLTITKTAAIGQTIVKQSWLPMEITDSKDKPDELKGWAEGNKIIQTPNPNPDPRESGLRVSDHFYPYVWKGDKFYKASKQTDLFIMLKLDPNTPGTDAGWVYGTVTPDSKQVTSAGRVATCMKCHQDAKHDRLFGLSKPIGN